MARPPGMFSVVGTTPITRIGAFSSAMARIAQTTAAPPAMSSFIRSMPSAGLIEMPPVSNVMPLPTSPSTGAGRRARRIVAKHHQPRRLAAAARHAEQQAHAELRRCAFRRAPRTSDRRLATMRAARRANSRGVSVLPGSFAELARQVAALAEQPAALRPLRERGLAAVGGSPAATIVHAGRRARRGVARLVAAAVELGERQAFGHRLRQFRRDRRAGDRPARSTNAARADAPLLQRRARLPSRPSAPGRR